MNVNILFRTSKRQWIKDDVIEAQKKAIIERLETIKENNDLENLDYYIKYSDHYFKFNSFDIETNKVSSLSSMLNSICKDQTSLEGETIKLIKCNRGRGSWASYVFSENVLRSYIKEIQTKKNERF